VWFRWVSAAFLREYRAGAVGATFVPEDPSQFAALLDAFMLDKAFYELNYELNNRPDWARIPLRGILDLLGQGAGTASPSVKGSTS
jgi:maltose alpha-D-glucosyltransferase/alpha-amylase